MKTAEAQAQLGSLLPERIGSTPLLRLDQLVRGLQGITLLGKAEWTNPGGSVKDRTAAALVRDAIARGALTPGKVLLDSSSGNHGIALAMLGAALSLPVHLAIPASISPERKRILAAFGATVDWTDPAECSDGAIRRAHELAGNDPKRFCFLDQYSNDANWLAHYHSTGAEIWQQTAGQVTHFVAGLGSCGTFMGAARRLKEFNSKLQAISVLPSSPTGGIRGLRHMGSSIVPAIYNPHLADRIVEIDAASACEMARGLAREEGLLVGLSAAAAVAVSLQIARQEAAAGRAAVIVAVLPDAADKALLERLWKES
jgi:cysteine synthase B